MLLAGTFIWEETHQTAEYTNWGGSQPDNENNEDCVFTLLRDDLNIGIGWNDFACDQETFTPSGVGTQFDNPIGIFALCMMKI